jgi:hypothetical protein
MFNRTIQGVDITTGEQKIRDDYYMLSNAKLTYSQKNRDGDRKKRALNSTKFKF